MVEAQQISDQAWQLLLHATTPERQQRVRQMRRRLNQIADSIANLIAREHALEMVAQQRLGRTNVEGELILPEDEAGADLLLSSYGIGGQ